VHTLELLPSIGKKHLAAILAAREEKPFANFADVHARVSSIGRVEDIFVQRILQELRGNEKYYLFAKAPSREFDRY
jgi:putative nucleotide binding protein